MMQSNIEHGEVCLCASVGVGVEALRTNMSKLDIWVVVVDFAHSLKQPKLGLQSGIITN